VDEEEDEPERRVMAVCYGPGGAGSLTTFVMLDPAGNLVDFLYCPQFRCARQYIWAVQHGAAQCSTQYTVVTCSKAGASCCGCCSALQLVQLHSHPHAACSVPCRAVPARSGPIPRRKALPGLVYDMFEDAKKGQDAARIRSFIEVRCSSH
jgi:hypothetical protein